MTATAHFHRMILVHDQSKLFSVRCSSKLLCCCSFFPQVGMEVDVPPLPRLAVQKQVAALRGQIVGNVCF